MLSRTQKQAWSFEATEEAKLAERMQDNFDATRAKICVMLSGAELQGKPLNPPVTFNA